jgi:GTP-dependent phosphoenolpyruvate carboxykinase
MWYQNELKGLCDMPKIQITHSCQIPSKHLTNFVSLHVNANKRTTCITINKYIYTYMHTYIHIYKLKKLKTYKIKIKQKKNEGWLDSHPQKLAGMRRHHPKRWLRLSCRYPQPMGVAALHPQPPLGVARKWL